MNDFLKKIIDGNSVTPLDVCLKAFSRNFGDALNIDWYDKGEFFEAIFYKDKIEHIAIFDLEGTLIEYKMHLPEGYLPESIKTFAETRGEIMSSVLRNKGNRIEYEVIVRDSLLTRYMINLTDMGIVLEEKEL
jgi:hypothetical protein